MLRFVSVVVDCVCMSLCFVFAFNVVVGWLMMLLFVVVGVMLVLFLVYVIVMCV